MIYTVKIEQTYHEPYRMKYIAQTDSFVAKNMKSLTYVSELTEAEKVDMHRLYPIEHPVEGWFGRQCAEGIVREFFCRKKRKTIITVQHTQSQHHVNGMIGAWAAASGD